jgi:hypothetical protein
MVAGLDAIEPASLVRNHAGEHVEAAGRAFRIGGRRNLLGQRQTFQQWHDVNAAGFQHGTVAERNFVQFQFVYAPGNRGAAGQKACAHAIGHLAQTQIEAGRLDLIRDELIFGQYAAIGGEHRDHPIRQNASVLNSERKCHGGPVCRRADLTQVAP